MKTTQELIDFWNLVMPHCDEVIWDKREGHLAVRYYGITGPSAGLNKDIYNVRQAKIIAGIALKKHKPVYILGKNDKKIQVFFNPVT